jgi:glycine transporter
MGRDADRMTPSLPRAYRADALLTVLDLTGTFVFAVEGALAAVGGNLDFFGLSRVATLELAESLGIVTTR